MLLATSLSVFTVLVIMVNMDSMSALVMRDPHTGGQDLTPMLGANWVTIFGAFGASGGYYRP